jgi:hypothetical protein
VSLTDMYHVSLTDMYHVSLTDMYHVSLTDMYHVSLTDMYHVSLTDMYHVSLTDMYHVSLTDMYHVSLTDMLQGLRRSRSLTCPSNVSQILTQSRQHHSTPRHPTPVPLLTSPHPLYCVSLWSSSSSSRDARLWNITSAPPAPDRGQ